MAEFEASALSDCLAEATDLWDVTYIHFFQNEVLPSSPATTYFREHKDLEEILEVLRNEIIESKSVDQVVGLVGSVRQNMSDAAVKVFEKTFAGFIEKSGGGIDPSESPQSEIDRLVTSAKLSDDLSSLPLISLSDEDQAALDIADLQSGLPTLNRLGLPVPPVFKEIVEDAPEPLFSQVLGEHFNDVFIAIGDIKPWYESFAEKWTPKPPRSGATANFQVAEFGVPRGGTKPTAIQPPLM